VVFDVKQEEKVKLMSDFWVGNFRVDVSRAQIIVKDDIISLEPRVLKVLLTLAKTPGEVVTHETLLENVWPNVVVAPNAVQRCIGQLRKALGDDAKQQKMIATHPKVGYSLVAKVEWPDTHLLEQAANPDEPQYSGKSAHSSNNSKSNNSKNEHRTKSIFALLFSCVSLFVFLWYFLPTTETSPPLDRLIPITSTDEKEYYPNFSPDGRYIVFNRYVSVCENELWIKDLSQNREFKLIEDSGFFGPAAWSPDGNQLAFTDIGGCQAQIDLDRCRNINAVSFLLAKTSPQVPRELLACQQHNYGAVNWLTNNKVAYIDSYARQGEVKSLDIDSGLTETLFSDTSYVPQALIYSQRNKQLAITVHDDMQNTSIVFINSQSKAVKHVQLKVPNDYSDFLWWDPSWHPLKDTMIATAKSSLFEIDMTGTVIEYPITTVADLYNPIYHPDGNKIVAVMGGVNLDILEFTFEDKELTSNNTTQMNAGKFQTRHSSTVEDFQAKYQPETDNVSFISARSGGQQLWFSQNNQLKQLSHFDHNTRINSYVWSLNGQSLALAIKGKLQLLTLDGEAKTITTPYKIIDVYQWYNEHEVLLSIIEQVSEQFKTHQRKVVLLDINTGAHKVIYQGFSHWAQLDKEQSLYYTNWDKRLHYFQDGNSSLFAPINGLNISSAFKIKQNKLMLYSEDKIWLYDFERKALSDIAIPSPPMRVAHMTDIDLTNKRVLFSIFKEARKDLVMFQRR